MSEPYEEIVEGETLRRCAPGERHERICARLQERLAEVLAQAATTRLLSPRSIVSLSAGTMIRPDLALVTAKNGKLWLAIEIINSSDHHTDTVTKKSLYEDVNVPRLWIVDPRYNNVEIYHSSEYGLILKGILAGRDVLSEQLLPGFEFIIDELFE